MTRERYIVHPKTGKLIPVHQYRREPSSGPVVVKDIEPYQSMVTGERIRSRSHHREHLRDHGMIEVGNDKPDVRRVELPRVGPDLQRAIAELKSRD